MGKTRGKKKKEEEFVIEEMEDGLDNETLAAMLLASDGEEDEAPAEQKPDVGRTKPAEAPKAGKTKSQLKREKKQAEEAALMKQMEQEVKEAVEAKEKAAWQRSQERPTRQRRQRSMNSCGVVYFAESSKSVLLLKNRKGHWDYPKGAIDPGESQVAAAKREFQEETGLPADFELSDPPDFEYAYDVRGQMKQVSLYLARVEEQPMSVEIKCDSREVVGFEFVS